MMANSPPTTVSLNGELHSSKKDDQEKKVSSSSSFKEDRQPSSDELVSSDNEEEQDNKAEQAPPSLFGKKHPPRTSIIPRLQTRKQLPLQTPTMMTLSCHWNNKMETLTENLTDKKPPTIMASSLLNEMIRFDNGMGCNYRTELTANENG
ncbi:hypothetical protein RYX36_027062 [Vicia faba]